ncbi:xylulokinase [Carboxydochorda subterranea]|uniref:Xylulose kinase n=1 Tax=Carboxydichorda subterranea TaxID=3109565 RepID=A0ABZ1BXB0_9FIRM|nr:xylulokinase [Limnochorda sp. L945t]WRP17324.1 xylulokinase [Limnochorda sp. L945t]
MAAGRYLIGCDVGTTGTKTLLVDEQGHVLARSLDEYPLLAPRPGWAEQEADDWYRATVQGIRKVVAEAGIRPQDVAGISFSGQMHGSVFLDREGRVIRRPLLWCDVRTADEVRAINETVGRARMIDLAGSPAMEGFTAPKVLWLRRHEPGHFERIATVLLPKDYVRFRLTGERAAEVSDAAGSAMFDIEKGEWSKELLDVVGLRPEQLPPVLRSVDVAGKLTARAAEETGLVPGIPVVAGGADNACGAVGAGVVRSGRAHVSIGSSGVVVSFAPVPSRDPGGRVHTFNHAVPGAWYVMGVMLAAGLSLRWVRDELGQAERAVQEATGIDAYELLTREASRSPAGARGLWFLPYLNGERTPHADPYARGVWFGLSSAHRRADLIRAVLEGVAFGLRDSLEVLQEMGVEVSQLRAIGGGGKSALWRQIQADVLGIPLARLNVDEGPAYGAALIAGAGVGVWSDVAEAADAVVKVNETIEPDPQRSATYEASYRIFRELYRVLRPVFEEAASLSS